MMKKILFALVGAGGVGAGGYYAKQMTGAVVGAGVGGVLGWLLAPGCTGGGYQFRPIAPAPGLKLMPGTPPPPSISTVPTQSCPQGFYFDWGTNQCKELIR